MPASFSQTGSPPVTNFLKLYFECCHILFKKSACICLHICVESVVPHKRLFTQLKWCHFALCYGYYLFVPY